MKTRYDKIADALYISFQNGKKRSLQTRKLKDFLLIDLDKKGKLMGIEILGASQHIPGFIKKRYVRTRKTVESEK